MTINRANFEAYMLDYLEGNLDPLLVADLMAFLAENPEFENLLPDPENISLTPDSVSYDRKDTLLKDFSSVSQINTGNLEEFCIAECEGLLSGDQSARLNFYMNENHEALSMLEKYRKIKLTADLSVTFADKHKLKKTARISAVSRLLFTGLAIAASIALALILVRPYSNHLNARNESRLVSAVKIAPAQNPAMDKEDIASATDSRRIKIGRHHNTGIHPKHSSDTGNAVKRLVENARLFAATPEVLEPITAYIPQLTLQSPVFDHKTAASTAEPDREKNQKRQENNVDSDNLLAVLVSKVDIWKTAETAITGFNHLTESQLSLNRVTDDKGNITRLVVNTERYSISGKMK